MHRRRGLLRIGAHTKAQRLDGGRRNAIGIHFSRLQWHSRNRHGRRPGHRRRDRLVLLGSGRQSCCVRLGSDHILAAWEGCNDVKQFAVDVADFDAAAQAVAQVAAWAGSVDVVVNNAGIARDAVVWKMTEDQWTSVLNVHLGGTYATTPAAIPLMRAAGGGRIINVTSFTGVRGNVGQANYAAAKGGIIGFTKSVAREVARFNVTVNAISPNASTSMVAAIPPDRLAEMTATVPLGRFAEPAEMAPAVAFLASKQAAYVTGIVLPVDGGVSM